jgi:hypothetical protein
MKAKILKLSLILLLFGFTTAGCQKDEIIDVRYPFKLQYAIHNEEGQEVKRIKEGENFYIYFSIENISENDSPIDDHYLFGNDELFKVFQRSTSNNISYIAGLQLLGCDENLGCLGQARSKFEYVLPWSSTKDSSMIVICCRYKLEKQPPLSIGKYLIKYTGNIPYYYRNENSEIESNETGSYNLA